MDCLTRGSIGPRTSCQVRNIEIAQPLVSWPSSLLYPMDNYRMACLSFSLGGPQKHLSERPHFEESQRKYTQAPDREVDSWPVGSREASDLEFPGRNFKR